MLKLRTTKTWKDEGEIEITGNLGTDPKRGTTPRGKNYAAYRMAVDVGSKTVWLDLRLFGESANWAFGLDREGKKFADGKALGKGDRVIVKGSYRRGPWEKRDKSVEMRHQVSCFKPGQLKRAEPRKDLRAWDALD